MDVGAQQQPRASRSSAHIAAGLARLATTALKHRLQMLMDFTVLRLCSSVHGTSTTACTQHLSCAPVAT